MITNIVSTEQYSITATLQTEMKISVLHFSMIIFDQTDVESSNRYVIISDQRDISTSGGF